MPTTAHKQHISSQTWRDLNWLLKSPSLVKDLAAYSSHTLSAESERQGDLQDSDSAQELTDQVHSTQSPAHDPSRHYEPKQSFEAAEFSSEQLDGLLAWLKHEHQCSSGNLDPLLSQQFRRLGLYAEALLQIALEQTPHTELLLRHCQIQEALSSNSSANKSSSSKGKHTIGELDFIWRDTQSKQIYHWELAVKLYLYVPELEDFVGTQKIDTLARKTRRLVEHQLPLGQHPQIQQRLGEIVNQSAYYLKGWLFYPIGDKNWDDYQLAPDAMMAPLNPQHLRGWWLYHSEFASRLNDDHMQLDNAELRSTELNNTPCGQTPLINSYRWTILPRLHWLSPVVKTNEQAINECMSSKELIDFMQAYFSASGRMDSALAEPILLSALLPGDDGHWYEAHRGFVVHEDWWL